MILGGGLITQALAGGGSSGGGKVNKLDMCDLFEQQTPLWSGNLFGDYSAKLVQLPEGTWYNRYQYYSTDTYAGIYCSTDTHNIACITGIYRGDTLLYLDYPSTTREQEDNYSINTVYNDDGTEKERVVYKNQTLKCNFSFSELTFTEYVNPTLYNGSIKVPCSAHNIYYAPDGTITSENTNQVNWSLSAQVYGSGWFFTRFSGEELKRQMDICMQDVYAEYLRTQTT